MKITKRNGNVSVYDDERVKRSILAANANAPFETITEAQAAAIADQVFQRVTVKYEIITTDEVRDCVIAVLKEKGLRQTAKLYAEYKK